MCNKRAREAYYEVEKKHITVKYNAEIIQTKKRKGKKVNLKLNNKTN